MEEDYGEVYAIIDGTNDFEYIGQTTRSVEERFKEHTKADSRIGYAIRAHGEDMFVAVVLKVCHSKAELDYWEQRLIKSRNSKHPNGYNMTDGGDGVIGMEFTPEHRAKISAAMSGEKNPNYGKPIPSEQRAKISAALTGKKKSPRTPEHCAKISAAKKGKTRSPEHCAHLSVAKRHYSPYKNLLAELDARQMSYTALAKLMGVYHPIIISRKMRDKYNFTERDKVKLVEIFGKAIEYLLARD